ncbi:DUF3883 domain-containing protein [Flagellimonas sp.]|uniref:DUF3883 domain-containing protein n=1 Tax=Flagellimonas sp. TaxID=2058762 RepID=UPI003BAB0CF1
MNRQILKSYISEYKTNFKKIHNQEIYKWKAIKQFQDHFNLESKDLHQNLNISLSKAGNLLASGTYYPKKMLLSNTHKSPEIIRKMFRALYDEEANILERIENFRVDFKKLNSTNFDDLNDYQDHRAILVYLSLRYPERYFLYKFRMFKDFAKKINFTYKPISGRLDNIGQFLNLCELIRYEIQNDQELLSLHDNRLDHNCYIDKNHNVLTQDFIYATVRHLNKTYIKNLKDLKIIKSDEIISSNLITKEEHVNFAAKITNYIQNSIDNKRIGDLGEIWVIKKEKEYLIENKKPKLAKKIEHVSKEQGDGLGYDILSFDLNGNKKYIEVKTTKGPLDSTFYVTKNELERSKIEEENYYLYRVYNYNEDNETGSLLRIKGNLSNICNIPVSFKVNLNQLTF